MNSFDVEFELFRKRVYEQETQSFYLMLLDRGMELDTLKSLFEDVDAILALKPQPFSIHANSPWVQAVLERVMEQEKMRARKTCFQKLFDQNLKFMEVMKMLGYSSVDLDLMADAIEVWQDRNL